MNKTVPTVAAFLLGAAAGAAGAWYILKDRYAQIAQEEIDSVKEAFLRRYSDPKKKDDSLTEDISDEKPEEEPTRATDMIKQEADEIIEKHDYTAYSTKPDISEVAKQVLSKKENGVKVDAPYIIPPEEFGEFEDYETIELTFFKDHIIADDELEIVEEVDRIIGFESLNHFGEYEDDAIFVRNDSLKCDYEVLLDDRTYAEAFASHPHHGGVL